MDDDDLHQRMAGLAGAVPSMGPADVRTVQHRVAVRRRRRLVAVASAAAVLGAGAAAAFAIGRADDPTQRVAASPSTDDAGPADPATATDPRRPVATVGGEDGPSTTAAKGALLPRAVVVDATDRIAVVGVDGSVVRDWTVYPGRGHDTRAAAVGDRIVVTAPAGDEVTVLDATAGTKRTVDLTHPGPTDLWAVGLRDGSPWMVYETLVDDGAGTYRSQTYGVDLADGSSRLLVDEPDAAAVQPTVGDDGTAFVGAWRGAEDCTIWRVDLATGARTDTPLPCLTEAAVSPDGTTMLDATANGIVRYDVATGRETGRWLEGELVSGEGAHLDFDGRYAVISNSYVDADHGRSLVLDTTTGTVVEVPLRGAASFLG